MVPESFAETRWDRYDPLASHRVGRAGKSGPPIVHPQS